MQLHLETDIRLVAAVIVHRLIPGNTRDGTLDIKTVNRLEQARHHTLEHVQHILLLDETHLAVNLRKLRLTVGAQVLITEAADDLEITVETGHHQQLLLLLRRLGKRIELTGIHSRRNDEIARSLRSTLDQIRRLNLEESVVRKIIANLLRNLVAQHQGVLERVAAKIEIAVTGPQVLAAIRFIFDGKRRSHRLVEHLKRRNLQLYIARRDLSVLALALLDNTLGTDDEFASQTRHHSGNGRIRRIIGTKLCDTVTVAQIDEIHSAHPAHALHPAGQRDFAAHIRAA